MNSDTDNNERNETWDNERTKQVCFSDTCAIHLNTCTCIIYMRAHVADEIHVWQCYIHAFRMEELTTILNALLSRCTNPIKIPKTGICLISSSYQRSF